MLNPITDTAGCFFTQTPTCLKIWLLNVHFSRGYQNSVRPANSHSWHNWNNSGKLCSYTKTDHMYWISFGIKSLLLLN